MMCEAASEEVSRGLVYNPEHSSLLVCSSNCTTEASHLHNCDQDAERVLSLMKKAGVTKDSMSTLITTASGDCTKKGLKEAIVAQTSKVIPDEYGLFIFIYCGGASDLNHDLSPKVSLSEFEDGFMAVDIDTKPSVHGLVLNDFDSENHKESHLSGQDLGAMIASSPVQPQQLLVVLDCPYAAEIGEDMEKHLGSCELNLIVSQEKDKMPYYLSPLGASNFSYFFCHFLSSREYTANGMVKLRCLFTNVQDCCNALSSLVMVRAGNKLTTNTATPEGRFVHIIDNANAAMKMIEEKDENVPDDETDNGGKFGKFLQRYYKNYFFKQPVKLCNEAKDWVHFVTRGPLLQLQDKGVLEGQVIDAAIGAMTFSIATIQSELHGDSICYSNLFLHAYIYIAAAIDMVNQDIDMLDVSRLKLAHEFYMKVVRAKSINEGEMKTLREKIERDIPNVFV